MAALCVSEMETHFLNIDLDIESKADISTLVSELEVSLTLMTNHVCEGINRASFESEYSIIEEIIENYVTAISLLGDEAALQWNNCRKREFNLGFQAENSPRSYEKSISAESLSKISSVNGQVGITVYAPEVAKHITSGST